MPSSPWKWCRQARPEREYLVLLSVLPLKRFSRIPWFLLHTLRVAGQLAAAGGLVGYSLNAEPLAKRFWTLSVWEDDAALRAFVGTPPRAQAMRVMTPHMGGVRRWEAQDDGVRRLGHARCERRSGPPRSGRCGSRETRPASAACRGRGPTLCRPRRRWEPEEP